jgi:hypothetical protein
LWASESSCLMLFLSIIIAYASDEYKDVKRSAAARILRGVGWRRMVIRIGRIAAHENRDQALPGR